MIAISLVYLAGLVGLLVLIDRRLKSAQVAREAAFLRDGFGSGVLVQRFERQAPRAGRCA